MSKTHSVYFHNIGRVTRLALCYNCNLIFSLDLASLLTTSESIPHLIHVAVSSKFSGHSPYSHFPLTVSTFNTILKSVKYALFISTTTDSIQSWMSFMRTVWTVLQCGISTSFSLPVPYISWPFNCLFHVGQSLLYFCWPSVTKRLYTLNLSHLQGLPYGVSLRLPLANGTSLG